MLYAQIRAQRPARILEIGSGHSTRFAARAIADGGLDTRLIAIDPEPRADLKALKVEWHRETLQQALKNSGGQVLAAFHPGDLLFVDSSHILMPGTDVELILTELLPRLPAGALVQIHDIFLPDAYPASWAWRGYNEQAAVAAMLAGGGWDILFAGRFARQRFDARLRAGPLGALPRCGRARRPACGSRNDDQKTWRAAVHFAIQVRHGRTWSDHPRVSSG